MVPINPEWQYSQWTNATSCLSQLMHDDVMKWNHFPRYWPFVRVIHRSTVNSLHKGQWRGALMFSLIYAWTNGWANNRDTGYLRRYRAQCGATVMHNAIITTLLHENNVTTLLSQTNVIVLHQLSIMMLYIQKHVWIFLNEGRQVIDW